MARDPINSKTSVEARHGLRWRRWLLALGLLLFLIFIFQRTILLAAIRFELARYAEGQKWELTCEISGDPIRNIEINGLDLKMDETDALESLKIKKIKASYHIFDLVVSGWSQVLGEVEVEDASLVMRDVAEKVDDNGSIVIPFPRSLRVKNFNFKKGSRQVTGLDLELLPEAPGSLGIGEVKWPSLGNWKTVSATTRYERGIIELKGLELNPWLKTESLRFDGSDLFKNQLEVVFRGLLFGGQTDLRFKWIAEGKNDFWDIDLKAKDLALGDVSHFLNNDKKFAGQATTFNLKFSGKWQDPSSWNGTLLASLRKGTVEDLPAWESLDITAKGDNGQVTVEQFALLLDTKNRLVGKGNLQLAAPFRYAGDLQGNLDDLSALQGLLSLAGIRQKLAGTLAVDWSGMGGGGIIPEARHRGKGFLVLQGGSFGETTGIEVEVRGDYNPETAIFQTVRASAAGWKVTGAATLQNRRLKFPDLEFFRGQKLVLEGLVDIPFYPGDWKNPGNWLNPEDPVIVHLRGRDIQLGDLMKGLGSSQPWKGVVNLNLDAEGTLKNLRLEGTLEGKNLGAGSYPHILPAQLKGELKIHEGQLNASALLTQPALPPVRFWGNTQFNATDYLDGSERWKKTPLRAELAMASLDLKRAKRFFPQVLELQGRLGMDIHLGGTLDRPLLWGEVAMDVPRLRFKNRTIPNLTGLVGRLKFEERSLQIETLRGNLAGGPFQLTGFTDFSTLNDPQIDLEFKGDDLLLFRNDQVTARADVLLGIKGPFTQAKIEGTVALTKSQFFREIDILPIGLLGHSAPEVKGSVLPEFSMKIFPVQDWRFDVKIFNKDPFLIKGNVANGRVDTKLHLTGSGLQPQLEGVVGISNLEATLPFSTMLLDRGFLYFKPGQGLNATVDFRGTSKIRDYLITAYVYGTVLRPQTLFVSQPPLSEQDIISLIAAGSTTSELGSNSGGGVIVGKATSLLFQKISRKLFPNAKVSKNELLDRVSFSVGSGGQDNATPSLGASLRISDEVYLIFDSGTEGSFRGRVKYLVRFR